MTAECEDSNLDPVWFRTVLGQYPTGVCIVTAIGQDSRPVGMSVGSFTSVSLDPPMVAFLPSKSSTSWPKIATSSKFCVNILADDQEPLCRAFSSKKQDKFEDFDWGAGPNGSPILKGSVAWIECDLDAVHDAGDHFIAVGRVVGLDVVRSTLPLLFFQGGYGRFSPLSLVAHDRRFGRQLHLVDRARPLIEDFAKRVDAQVIVTHCDGAVQTTLASAGTPSNPRSSAPEIGQRIHVTPPIGIWWMAFASPDVVETWLSALGSAEQIEHYRTAMELVRQSGYCLGLTTIQHQVRALVAGREHPHDEPQGDERDRIKSFRLDPLSYVPSRISPEATTSSQKDVVSLWAPTFAPDGNVDLGLAIIGYPMDSTPLSSYANHLLKLSRTITDLAST